MNSGWRMWMWIWSLDNGIFKGKFSADVCGFVFSFFKYVFLFKGAQSLDLWPIAVTRCALQSNQSNLSSRTRKHATNSSGMWGCRLKPPYQHRYTFLTMGSVGVGETVTLHACEGRLVGNSGGLSQFPHDTNSQSPAPLCSSLESISHPLSLWLNRGCEPVTHGACLPTYTRKERM